MQKSILVVDDETDILDMLRYNLSKEGYNVLTARSGKAALEQAKHLGSVEWDEAGVARVLLR